MKSLYGCDNNVHLHALVSGTFFPVLGTLHYLYEHCLYITYYRLTVSFVAVFINIPQKVSHKHSFTTFTLKYCLPYQTI